MKLKIVAIIRRTFERLLFRKMKDWQDREDLVQYADVKLYDPQAVSDLLDSIPMDRVTKGTPFHWIWFNISSRKAYEETANIGAGFGQSIGQTMAMM